MFNNLDKEKVENFKRNPYEYLKQFEEYMIRICEEKLGNKPNELSKLYTIVTIEGKYPNVKGACEELFSHFFKTDNLPLEERVDSLIEAISQIKEI